MDPENPAPAPLVAGPGNGFGLPAGAIPSDERARQLWPDSIGRVELDDLVGTPEWLDELAALPPHSRIAAGYTFKVLDVSNGEAVFLADFDREVPTAAVLRSRFPDGGSFVVRASKRRAGRGGGNLTEVRVRIAPARDTSSGTEGKAFALLRDVLASRNALGPAQRESAPKLDAILDGVREVGAEIVRALSPAAPDGEGDDAPAAAKGSGLGALLREGMELVRASGLAPRLAALLFPAPAPAAAAAPAAAPAS